MHNIEKPTFLNPSITRQSTQGFTLIELVMVIVILGILSVVALPKLAEFGTDARIASLESLEGAMRTAASTAHTLAVIENKTDCATDPTIDLEGQTITLRCGYPCPHPSGIARAVDTGGNFSVVGGNCAGQLGAVEIRVSDAPDPVNCKVRYTSARATRPPGYTLTTSGC